MRARTAPMTYAMRPLTAPILWSAVLWTALAMTAGEARAADLIVRYDQSQLLRLPRAAAEVIIGNPSIADVTVQGGTLLVITGKTFGVTNFIALDAERNIIADQRVLVERDERRVVHLHKAGQRQSYACTPNCQPTITIGDDTAYLNSIVKDSAAKTKFSAETNDTAQPTQ